MTSRIGFGCPGIPTFARGEGRLYLSPNIDLPSPFAKFRRRVCQNRFLKLFQYKGIFVTSFAIALRPTPLLNSPDFDAVFGGKNGDKLLLDETGLIRAVETIAFPGSKFKILTPKDDLIYEAIFDEYSSKPVYLDRRFIEFVDAKYPQRKILLPPKEKIISDLSSLIGSRYIWGGNQSSGIPEMLSYYPPSTSLSSILEELWTLKGIDCSGLLYQVTDGYTPRNTSSLITFGLPIPIENCSLAEIKKKLKPLDLLVWKGHIIIVLNSEITIESKHEMGKTFCRPIDETLDFLLKERMPSNTPSSHPYFLLRRWYDI
jgi:hypothetical protein